MKGVVLALRDRLAKLEKAKGSGMVFIPQPDGTVKRFPQSAPQDSFLTNMKRLRGEDVPPHPLGVAAAQSSDPEWSRSMFSADWVEIVTPPEDLSEP
jgi:hypothetical protein